MQKIFYHNVGHNEMSALHVAQPRENLSEKRSPFIVKVEVSLSHVRECHYWKECFGFPTLNFAKRAEATSFSDSTNV
jgi:hypothetical protein